MTVTITDRSFKVTPVILQSGTTTFVVRNAGKKSHVFAISGPGSEERANRSPRRRARAAHADRERCGPGRTCSSDPALGPYSAEYVNVIRATSLTASGNGSVVAPEVTLPPMCGATYTP